jgi:hypothetical protein
MKCGYLSLEEMDLKILINTGSYAKLYGVSRKSMMNMLRDLSLELP